MQKNVKRVTACCTCDRNVMRGAAADTWGECKSRGHGINIWTYYLHMIRIHI